MSRGRLILIEGLDRTGKSTQCDILCEKLNGTLMKFPQRETKIGQLINNYLTDKSFKMPDQSIHLLFSANRWEMSEIIQTELNNGRDVILDRYVYSGIAYSSAKHISGMDIDWCYQCDKGLIRPDITVFLTNDSNNDDREGFGEERYENIEFQKVVKLKFYEIFKKLDNLKEGEEAGENGLQIINVTNKNIDEVTGLILERIQPFLNKKYNGNEFMYF
ncbi:hypothetical protein Kpol_529p17 [Vanderwaltozyma polyspora DSM 70294]|uniref:dTMP kinase n=1 Tax=Vanderwaltozyma polyspora (strain ATCC 22028 / DSM 70294 / BCRC 21397 / CBS 2163 / NBRC 10782 / NRRL Y-8283 / UCD 57-17) TaxID=436907 RepID=A7TM70_VANPO|nr:uncharacterized protein Kpol_529p17 [Vanderwaltozyma polyspora DSM 70294]EDO16637.1 hypothetical protein Kpol_529p17 [Vanderwaltozyma polyspora DSM 70294]